MATLDKGRQLARAIAKGRASRRERLPQNLHDEAVAYAHHRVSEGATAHKIAHELGVAVMTVRRWLAKQSSPAPARPRLKLRRVRVIEKRATAQSTDAGGAIVILADGVRIEGMTIANVIELVRGLR